MIPSHNNKRGARRVRQNKSPVKVISMTQTEAFEATLSTSNDSTVLRGKVLTSSALTSTPVNLLTLVPTNTAFGVRSVAMGTIFSRYRFKYLKIRFLCNTTNQGTTALGVQDDISITANNPTSISGIAELRCSGTALGSQTVPTVFEWRPADTRWWYYTTNDLTDPRLSTSGILWAAGASPVEVEIDYCIVFKGATDAGAS